MSFRPSLLTSILLVLLTGGAVAADGLALPDGRIVWPQWQARITLSETPLAPVSLTERAKSRLAQRPAGANGALLGDFFFDTPGLQLPASLGGLRATSGLMVTARGFFQPSADTVPYLGVGYTGLGLKGGWGITADVGLALDYPGRSVLGTQATDTAVRELRLSPLLQLGVRYAF